MPRTISTSFRASIDEPYDPDAPVVFLLLEHPSLDAPIQLAGDVVDYYRGGEVWIGCPFEIELPSDTEDAPRATIRVQNVDRRIGLGIREINDSPTLTIEVGAASDWTDELVSGPGLALNFLDETLFASDDPDIRVRLPIGEPVIEYRASGMTFTSVSVDAIAVEADLAVYDRTTTPWPGVLATQARLPGLFR